MLTFLVLCLSIAITVGLLFFSLGIRNDKHQLESDLQDLKTQIKSLRYEKDVLMTKLVLAESRSKLSSTVKTPPQNQAAINRQNSNKYGESRPTAPAAKPQKKAPPPKAAKATAMEEPPASSLKVAVEKFKVSPQAEENLLRVQFKIKNASLNSQRVSGHAIVVLKGDPLKREKWLTIPKVPLSNGKPTGRQPGYSFGINHFKTMRFKTNLPKSLEIYQVATVFIFTQKGELLLEENFPVKLGAEKLIKASKPPSRAPSASSPSSSPTSAHPPSVKKVTDPPRDD